MNVNYLSVGAKYGSQLQTGLLVYYKFDEPSGTTCADAFGITANNAVAAAGSPPTATAKIGSYARDFQLGTGGITVPNAPFAVNGGVFNTFSVSFWVKFDTLPSVAERNYYIFTLANSGNSSVFSCWMSSSDDYIRFKVQDLVTNDNEIFLKQITDVTNYMHVVLVANGNGNPLKGYINGAENVMWGGHNQTVIPAAVNNPNYHTIGNSFVSSAYELDGKIDEIGFWNRALTTTEITALYNSGSGVAFPF